MAQASSATAKPPASANLAGPLPSVRLEMRHGSARPTVHEVTDVGFLVGSVPGCDLRLPGVNLPPVLCLISRHSTGVVLRKMAPVLPMLVNGQSVAMTTLNQGDRITLGAVDLLVQVSMAPSTTNSPISPKAGSHPTSTESQLAPTLDERERQLAESERALQEHLEELETDRAIWYRRREQVELECQQQSEGMSARHRELQQRERELSEARADVVEREQALRFAKEEIDAKHAKVSTALEELAHQQEELAGTRRELADLRQQLYDRYRERRDRLAGVQEAVRKAARKVQERKRHLEVEVARFEADKQDDGARRAQLDARAEELAKERTLLDEQKCLLDGRQEQLQKDLTDRLNEIQERERALVEERQAMEKSHDDHQSDLVRLDRLEGVLEKRQKQLQVHAREIDQRFEQLQRDSRELEEQATELDEMQTKLLADTEVLNQRKAEEDATHAQLNQRAAALEGQQSMLAALRTRLERMREEVQRSEARLSEQQSRQAEIEIDIQKKLHDATQIRADLETDKQMHDQERHRFQERQTILEQAVAQLRQVQESLSGEEAKLGQRESDLEAKTNELTEQTALLQARTEQLAEQEQRLNADRQAIRVREAELVKSEQALAALQEQLRRRSEDLASRQKSQGDHHRQQDEAVTQLSAQKEDFERQRREAEETLAGLRQELESKSVEIARERVELTEREAAFRGQVEAHEQSTTKVSQEHVKLTELREEWDKDQSAVAADLARQRSELDAARVEATAMGSQLAEMQEKVASALEKLTQTRGQLRDHLTQVHGYAQQSRADLEAMRGQVRTEAERVRLEELSLHKVRDDHRLAVAAFRQQLLDWQTQVAELKQSLAQGETRLDRRQAEVEAQARQIDSTSVRLAQQAEELQEQQRAVAERRGEMERHLNDMRDWYRRKLRELAGVQGPVAVAELKANKSTDEAVVAPDSSEVAGSEMTETETSGDRGILSLTGDIEPGDQQLGDLLKSSRLIDADTLTVLLVEARRQRRSLRHLLLAGGYLTLYQMALIEVGNLDGLVIGPLRVIDRFRATAHEAVYWVFDPRSNQEAVLRHLAEGEMQNAGRAKEFRKRFEQAASLRHPSLAATWEVLDIAGRPAVLQEYVTGVPSTDWPILAAAPGVWYRLLCQAALGMHTAHEAGLVHGHLDGGLVVLTRESIVKLCGFGEPDWLATPPVTRQDEATLADDLMALGRLAAAWANAEIDGKRAKVKPLPPELQTVLHKLTTEDAETRYPSAAALLEDLDAAGTTVPANSTAWDRFVKQVREQTGEAVAARKSA